LLLSVSAAARLLKVDSRNLKREILAGNCPGVRFGSRLRIDDGVLQRWLEGRLASAASPSGASSAVGEQR
jgi:excisionase family DNA binding protein